ncbi:hypothetical protein M408DRAFT_28777 [Serendipita vermifera MAFF 305830]|uniref:Uncharacterized protein n=1 Tax=Serendipita vermifera MAFF 305830 TaxID=933852 RepID=A0A0C3ASX8_SERVB|nr:hypothetical protein M408DRAFT_30172 [Serendipita vermifera MAFF 305830]KIM22396.1 hypothetical protein M408DRAFT_28777 [Serendipita vermifera MAFF 305830]
MAHQAWLSPIPVPLSSSFRIHLPRYQTLQAPCLTVFVSSEAVGLVSISSITVLVHGKTPPTSSPVYEPIHQLERLTKDMWMAAFKGPCSELLARPRGPQRVACLRHRLLQDGHAGETGRAGGEERSGHWGVSGRHFERLFENAAFMIVLRPIYTALHL